MGALSARAVRGLPEITPGDDLAALILEAGDEPTDDEIIVIAQRSRRPRGRASWRRSSVRTSATCRRSSMSQASCCGPSAAC
jgi:hypothetical protein